MSESEKVREEEEPRTEGDRHHGPSTWGHHLSFLISLVNMGFRTQKASSGMPSGDQLASSLALQILDMETESQRWTLSDSRTHSILLPVCVFQVLVCSDSWLL